MDVLLQAKAGRDGPTWIDFDYIDGSDPKEARRPGVYLRLRRVHNDLKGFRVGQFMTRQLYDWAFRRGLPVYADYSISPEAQRLDASMRRLGYRYEPINPFIIDSDGHMLNMEMKPIFVIDAGEAIAPYEAAPLPRDDYRIDDPMTLRARQQRVDEARARQKAYDDASPAEQALMDDPDMLMSFGARKVSAREALENAQLEQETARRVSLGAQAAAKCAARHGMGQSFIAATAGSGARWAGFGQGLGLAASIPLGLAGAPILARNAREAGDPIGTRLNDGRLAGVEAGLYNPPELNEPDAGMGLDDVLSDAPETEPAPVAQPMVREEPSLALQTDFARPPEVSGGRAGFAPPDAPSEAEPDPTRDLIRLFDPLVNPEPDQ
jgi:hypothetical protein